jgi:hypothetical protein
LPLPGGRPAQQDLFSPGLHRSWLQSG